MPMENQNYIMREITPLSERDCFYIADRRKTEFTYPIHCHAEYELNFTEHASGVRRVVGDSAEIIGDYDLVLVRSWSMYGSNMNVPPGIFGRLPFSSLPTCSSGTLSTRTSSTVSVGCWSVHSADLVSPCRPS